VTAGFLWALNSGIEWLERRGVVDTVRPDDRPHFVQERLYERRGRWFETSRMGRRDMVASRFRAKKGDAFRVFVVGGSFSMGTPYVHQSSEGRGGIADFLRAELEARGPGFDVEIINAAAGSGDAGRTRQTVTEILDYEPDAIVLASCNNEGALRPGPLREYLHRQGTYRLLRTLLVFPPAPSQRSWYTPQDETSEALRDGFRENIRDMVQASAQRGVPILVSTLPVNLRYRGFEPGPTVEENGDPAPGGGPDTLPDDPAAGQGGLADPPSGLTAEELDSLPACRSGVYLFEAEAWAAALPLLRRCLLQASDPVYTAPWITTYVALAELELGIAGEAAEARLRGAWGDCLAQGILSYYAGSWDEASNQLAQCDDVVEAGRWLGLVRLAQGDAAEAERLLRQTVELAPRNRCRPSLNAVIREEAEAEGATLVDLEGAAARAADDGLPGPDLFVDYCHMNWRGYRLMAHEVLARLDQRFPRLQPAAPALTEAQLAAEFGLPSPDDRAGQAVLGLRREGSWHQH